NQYCQIPDAPDNTNYSPAIGLSTQNDASPELFTAYTQWPNPVTPFYYFGLKTVDWSMTGGFRPEVPLTVVETNKDHLLYVFLNPFSTDFTIALEGDQTNMFY